MKTILVTGGTGFIGSHLCTRLVEQGHHVICLDNNFTGCLNNIAHLRNLNNFEFIRHDVVDSINIEVDFIYHLACPASPKAYALNPIKTIKTNIMGTLNMLGLAKRLKCRILLSSTSEVYGDPLENPQKETYWGNVNPIGDRSCYDEGKRCAESIMMAYHTYNGVDIRIARIFNTYGPRLAKDDGRVVSNFIMQALENNPITLYGDGSQTRSFCYVDDTVSGLIALMNNEHTIGPVNIGNPNEITIKTLAETIIQLMHSTSQLTYLSLPNDDPKCRKPDISKAQNLLSWHPVTDLHDGLRFTIKYFENC